MLFTRSLLLPTLNLLPPFLKDLPDGRSIVAGTVLSVLPLATLLQHAAATASRRAPGQFLDAIGAFAQQAEFLTTKATLLTPSFRPLLLALLRQSH